MFEGDIRNISVPIIEPSIQFELNQDYSGSWLVVGDLDGQGKIQFVSARNDNQAITAVSAYSHEGNLMWTWGEAGAGGQRLSYDCPLQVYDLTGDGKDEVIFSTYGKIVILEGATGKKLHIFSLPPELPVADCIVFANLSGNSRATDIIIKSRYKKLWAYTADWALLWSWKPKRGHKTCHHPTVVDIDGDGKDEVFAGPDMLNHDGTSLWSINHLQWGKRGHLDCVRIANTGDSPKDFRFVLSYCGANYIAMVDGTGKKIWKHKGHHYESIDLGYFRKDSPFPQFYVDIDHLPFGKSLGKFYNDSGNQFGTVFLDYGRQHRAVDWTGDGLDEIVIANALAICNGYGKRIVTLAYRDGASLLYPPLTPPAHDFHMAIIDYNGNGIGDIMIHTRNNVNLYTNLKGKPSERQRFDGVNFTFY